MRVLTLDEMVAVTGGTGSCKPVKVKKPKKDKCDNGAGSGDDSDCDVGGGKGSGKDYCKPVVVCPPVTC